MMMRIKEYAKKKGSFGFSFTIKVFIKFNRSIFQLRIWFYSCYFYL